MPGWLVDCYKLWELLEQISESIYPWFSHEKDIIFPSIRTNSSSHARHNTLGGSADGGIGVKGMTSWKRGFSHGWENTESCLGFRGVGLLSTLDGISLSPKALHLKIIVELVWCNLDHFESKAATTPNILAWCDPNQHAEFYFFIVYII